MGFHRRHFRPLSCQAGQGAVEYILMLVIVVSIVIGLIYQFNKDFERYANAFFGDYLTCLIAMGELPSLGGGGGSESACLAELQAFNQAGQQMASRGAGAGNKSGENAEGEEGDGEGEEGSGGDSKANKRSGGGATAGGGVRSRRRGNRFRAGNKWKDQEVASQKSGKEESATAGYVNVNSPTSGGNAEPLRQNRMLISRGGASEKEEKEAKRAKPLVKTEEARGRGQRIKINRTLASDQKDLDVEAEFTLGGLVRFLIFVGILIALLMFLGGQALQLSKSME